MSCPSVFTYEFCQCLTNLASVCTKRDVFNAQKLQFKTKKPFKPSITKKRLKKNKKIFRPTDPILFLHESLNRHIFFFGLRYFKETRSSDSVVIFSIQKFTYI